MFMQLNDSAQEQGNGSLGLIRTSCLYMNRYHFMRFVRLHLEIANCRRMRTVLEQTQ